jgi:hypothetical protein
METPRDGDGAREPGKWWSRRATVWLIGALALITATSAAALTSSGPNAAAPRPASDTHRNALDSILLKNPSIGTPIGQLIRAGKLPEPTYRGDTGRVGVPAHLSHPTLPAGQISRYVPGSVTGDFNLLQLASLALYEGCSRSEAPIAAAIAAAESGGNPGAQGDISLMDGTWDWSQGLWQIRGLHSERGTGGLRDSLANADPEKNASAMYAISNGCTDWTPWSTYTSGAYLAYLGMSKTAVLAAKRYQGETGSLPPYDSGAPAAVPAVPPTPPSSSHSKSQPSGKSSNRPKSGGSSHSSQPGRHAPGGSSTGAAANNPSATHAPNPGASNPAPTKPKPSLPVPLPTKSKLPVPVPTKTAVPTKLPLPTKPKLPLPTTPKLPVPTPTVSVP